MSKAKKKFGTGLRVLEVLRLLLQQNLKKTDIINDLKESEKVESVFTQEAFIKYFNTLKTLGISIDKIKNRYYLKNALLQIDLTRKEKDIILKVVEDFRHLHNKQAERVIYDILSRLNKYLKSPYSLDELEDVFTKEIQSSFDETKEKLIVSIESMLRDGQFVKITYRKNKHTTEVLTVELKDIIKKNKVVFVHCYCSSLAKNKTIKLDSIISLEQSPRKIQGNVAPNTVIFKLYDRLIKTYQLKDYEQIISFNPEYILVSNSNEDKDMLMRRLLKYGEYCKIVRPKSFKDEFISMTNDVLKNLGDCEK